MLGENAAEFSSRIGEVATTLRQPVKSTETTVREVMGAQATRLIQNGHRDVLVQGLREVEQAMAQQGHAVQLLPQGDSAQISDQEVAEAFGELGARYLTHADAKGESAAASPIAPQQGNDSTPRWLYSVVQGSRVGRLVDSVVRLIRQALRKVGRATGFVAKSARSLDELFQIAGIDPQGGKVTAKQAKRLLQALRKENPVTVDEVVLPMAGWGDFNKVRLSAIIQEVLDMVPPGLAEKLKKHPVRVEMVTNEDLKDEDGSENSGDYKDWVVRLNREKIFTQDAMRRVIFHEMAHWFEHADAREGGAYKSLIDEFVLERTNGATELRPLNRKYGIPYDPPILGVQGEFADIFGDEYGGRAYDGEVGREIPSTRIEKLSRGTDELANQLNKQMDKRGYLWRESFIEALKIFFD